MAKLITLDMTKDTAPIKQLLRIESSITTSYQLMNTVSDALFDDAQANYKANLANAATQIERWGLTYTRNRWSTTQRHPLVPDLGTVPNAIIVAYYYESRREFGAVVGLRIAKGAGEHPKIMMLINRLMIMNIDDEYTRYPVDVGYPLTLAEWPLIEMVKNLAENYVTKPGQYLTAEDLWWTRYGKKGAPIALLEAQDRNDFIKVVDFHSIIDEFLTVHWKDDDDRSASLADFAEGLDTHTIDADTGVKTRTDNPKWLLPIAPASVGIWLPKSISVRYLTDESKESDLIPVNMLVGVATQVAATSLHSGGSSHNPIGPYIRGGEIDLALSNTIDRGNISPEESEWFKILMPSPLAFDMASLEDVEKFIEENEDSLDEATLTQVEVLKEEKNRLEGKIKKVAWWFFDPIFQPSHQRLEQEFGRSVLAKMISADGANDKVNAERNLKQYLAVTLGFIEENRLKAHTMSKSTDPDIDVPLTISAVQMLGTIIQRSKFKQSFDEELTQMLETLATNISQFPDSDIWRTMVEHVKEHTLRLYPGNNRIKAAFTEIFRKTEGLEGAPAPTGVTIIASRVIEDLVDKKWDGGVRTIQEIEREIMDKIELARDTAGEPELAQKELNALKLSIRTITASKYRMERPQGIYNTLLNAEMNRSYKTRLPLGLIINTIFDFGDQIGRLTIHGSKTIEYGPAVNRIVGYIPSATTFDMSLMGFSAVGVHNVGRRPRPDQPPRRQILVGGTKITWDPAPSARYTRDPIIPFAAPGGTAVVYRNFDMATKQELSSVNLRMFMGTIVRDNSSKTGFVVADFRYVSDDGDQTPVLGSCGGPLLIVDGQKHFRVDYLLLVTELELDE